MHLISRKKFRPFVKDYADALVPLSRWFKLARRAHWSNFAGVRADFPQADQVERFIVFNVGGNKYRLIVEINYRTQRVYIRHVLTHMEYDRGAWKN